MDQFHLQVQPSLENTSYTYKYNKTITTLLLSHSENMLTKQQLD